MPVARNRWLARHAAALVVAIGMPGCGSGGDAASTSGPAPSSSATGSPAGSSSTAGAETTAADGIYAVTITERDAGDAGVPKGRFSQVVGDYELDLVRGQLAMYFTGVITLDLLRGTYTVRGRKLELVSDGGPTLHLTWARDHGDLSLTLESTDDPGSRALDEMIFSTHTWRRTG